jgi:hypothetical protein
MVMASLNSLKAAGIDNNGVVTTDGAGKITLPSIVLSSLFQSTVPLTINDGATTNGTTAGTCVKYAICIGQFKAYLFYFSGYRNSTATEQRITLDTAYTSRVLWVAGNIPTTSPWNAGAQVANKSGAVDGLSSSGGTTGGYTGMHPLDFGEVTNAMDQLGLGVSQGSTFTGLLFMIGV